MKELVRQRTCRLVPEKSEQSPGLRGRVVRLRLGEVKRTAARDRAGNAAVLRLHGVAGGGVQQRQFVVPHRLGVVGWAGDEKRAALALPACDPAEGVGGEI